MGKIKGWRKSFEAPDSISYQSSEELYTPEMDGVIPKGALIGIERIRGAPGWKSLSEPGGYTIDKIPFVSKRRALDTIVDWMKRTKPTTDKPSTSKSMTITLSAYQYVETVYFQGEDNEAEDFVQNIFVDGWKGVQKEYPTLDKIDWGFVTLEMFYLTEEFVELSKFLNMPIVDHTIELSAPEFDPARVKLESKVKIIWK
ncbi:hypothetical protein KAU33_15585 [Candidatus Dependentiae bacterium]|nr:hypothetical protein [Candidatus Dependentiae bacterium]